PDIFAISAVVSTAYEYTKRLSLDVKKMLPNTLIVLGGNLGASANVLLRRTGVDICVLGEGEIPFLDVVHRTEETRDPTKFKDIPGLVLLEGDELVNTGYAKTLSKRVVYEINWDDVENSSDINMFFPVADDNITGHDDITHDPRFFEDHRRGKRVGTLYTAKGCVSRCTFCHRWDKGIRFIPVDIAMRRLDEIIIRYNVGILHIADENFGTDKRWLEEFCAEIKKRDVLWRAGTRAKGITPEVIAMVKEAGCTSLVYGNETGSPRMLEIMEKKVSIKDNYNAVKWAIEAELDSKVQLVCGMPGETSETIGETIEFCKFTNAISPRQNPNDLSINYAQALPGTPLYEYARSEGLIGKDLDGEEQYLLDISDRDAHDEFSTLNFTGFPKLECETWRPRITVEVNHHYVRKFGIEHYRKVLLKDTNFFDGVAPSAGYYANPRRLVETRGDFSDHNAADAPAYPSLMTLLLARRWGLALICYPVLAYRLRRFLFLLVTFKNLSRYGFGYTMSLLGAYFLYIVSPDRRERAYKRPYKSLRKIVNDDIGVLSNDEETMK
ncbi:MAG: radical SAM protein, partial [Rectinemataceae bacterium]|nr:radical SAM protein [Rectinemataceae bacterium]